MKVKSLGMLVVLLLTALLCCSCVQGSPAEPSGGTGSSDKAETTSGAGTGSTAEDPPPLSTSDTAAEPIHGSFEVVGPYENILEERPFVSFGAFSGDRGTYVGKNSIGQYELQLPVRVRVVGMQEGDYNGGIWSVYYVQVTGIYGKGYSLELGEVYTMAYAGTPEHPLYGRPPLEIGKEYLRLYTAYRIGSEELNMGPALMMPIEEIDGVEYVYGYGLDLRSMSSAVAITDEEENAVYKPGKHDGMIAQVEADGEALPTFDYKCELSAFLLEIEAST